MLFLYVLFALSASPVATSPVVAASCAAPEEHNDPTGKVESPNYPANYPVNEDRCYLITVTAGKAVSLTFTHFTTEACCDTVELYDGTAAQGVLITDPPLSGVEPEGKTYQTTGNVMTVRFVSDKEKTRPGFSADYAAIAPATTTAAPP